MIPSVNFIYNYKILRTTLNIFVRVIKYIYKLNKKGRF